MKSHVLVLSGLLLAAPAIAQTSDTNSSQPPARSGAASANGEDGEAANDPNRRICRKVETNTGSRVPHRTVCLTARQWQNYRSN